MKRFFFLSVLLSCIAFVVGCGSSAESKNEAEVPTVGTTVANSQVDLKLPVVGDPSAEQIARWTPEPFEPLELLAIHEWEKTSFTSCLAGTPDGKHYIVAGSRVLLWPIVGDEPEHVFLELGEGEDRDQRSLAVAPDGKWFAVGDGEGMLRVWNLASHEEIAAKKIYPSGVQYLAISPDGVEIATISYNSEVTIWNAADLKQKNKFKVDTNSLDRIEYMSSNVLAAAGESTSAWNTDTGKLEQQLSPGRYSYALARSPDGEKFVFGSDDKLVIWNIKTGKPESEITHEVSGKEQLAFSPDGKYLATNNGRVIELWNLAERRVVQVIDSFGWPMVGISWLPKTNLLVVASDIGCTRVWGIGTQGGTREQIAAVGLKPLHVARAAPNPESQAPATPDQMKRMIDLRTLPRLPESETSVLASDSLSCLVPQGAEEAKTFYRYFLEKEGWALAKTPSTNPAALKFDKQGFRITASFYDAGEGKTNVMLGHAGNYNVTLVPKFDAAPIEKVYENEDTAIYRTKADLIAIETTLLRKLHEAGWTAYSRLKSSHSERPDARDLDFLRNGTTLRISIGKFPAEPDSYTIQYGLSSNNSSVPVPPDSGFVEFDGSTDPTLIATTELTLHEAIEFYDEEMAKEGWLEREQGRSSKDDRAWLSYLRGQSDVTIGLTKLKDGRTLVQVGSASQSLWEASLPVEEEVEAKVVVGLEAADFPLLDAAKTAKFDPIDKRIEVEIEGSTLAAAAEQYTNALKELGWKHDGRGIRDEEYTFLTYEKGDVDISLRARSQEGKAMVSFSGDGLLWNKELPGGKQVVSYERWLELNKLPASLEFLDRYEAEMRAVTRP